MSDETAPIPSCSADQIQARRDAIVAAAEAVVGTVTGVDGFPRLFVDYGNRSELTVDLVRRRADADAWQEMLTGSGLWSFMDQTARDHWREMMAQAHQESRHREPVHVPQFTAEAAQEVAEQIHAERGNMVARGVADVFRSLSSDYVTNGPMAFGQKIIIRGIGSCWGRGWFSVSHRVCDKLDDLDRFLRIARGLAERDHRRGSWQILSSTAAHPPSVVEMDYWHVRLFKNGNGHLTFKHEADVLRLNKLLSIHAGAVIPDTSRPGSRHR